ncbi:MAG: hypothetical protein WBI06_00655, partial [Paludibacter sp.]
MNKITYFKTMLLAVVLLVGSGSAWGQTNSYLGLDGGFEGTATIDNTAAYSAAQSGKWCHSTSNVSIASELSFVRSGSKSVKVTSTSTTLGRLYSPALTMAASTTKWVLQYYRYSTSTNIISENEVNRGGNASATSSYTAVTATSTWEKVTYAPESVVSATAGNIATIIKLSAAGSDDFYYDDFCLYESASGVDITAPDAPTSPNAAPAVNSLNVSWTAPSAGVDGGGYLVVRGTADPTTAPNVNGIYAVGNTIGTGTIVYQGTGTSFTDTGLSSGTPYYYRIYSYDKAYNYSTTLTASGTPVDASTPTITLTPTSLTGFTYVQGAGPSAEQTFTVSGTNLTSNISLAASTNYEISKTSGSDYTTQLTFTPAEVATAQTVYVRLKAWLTQGDYNTEVINVTSTDATTQTVTCSGSVTVPVATNIIINEVDADTPGTDAVEFIELYDGGVGNTSLNGLVVVLFNGNNSTSYNAFDLDGKSTNANGYFVIGSTGMGTGIEVTPGGSGWLQNGQDAVALYKGNGTDFPDGTAIKTTNLIDALVYETNDTDGADLLVLLNVGQIQIDENSRSKSDYHSYQRLPNGSGGVRNTNTYDLTYPTLGTANVFQAVTWTGTTDTNWATATNWTPNLVPDRGVNATLTNVTNAAVIGANASVNNLIIEPNAKLTLNSAFTLAVVGNLTIQSDLSGSGTFKNSGTLSVSGTSKVQQYLTNQSWYLTSPVQGTVTPTNLSRIQGYNEGVGTGNDWSVSGTTMTAGKGYITSVSAAPNTVEFTGTINSGNFSIDLTRHDVTDANKYGFNLIGNPYTAYLDWKAVSAANSAKMPTLTMWYRTKVSGSWNFSTVNGSGVASPANVSHMIPPMQAFWVRASTVGNSTLYLTNDMVFHDDNATNKLKAPSSSKAERQIVRLQVSNATNTDELVIYTDADASNGYDRFDSPKFEEENMVTQIYTTAGNEKLVINGMNSIPLDTEISLGFVPGNATTFSLKANEISNLPSDVKVILKDNGNNGVETDLTDCVTTYDFAPATTTG